MNPLQTAIKKLGWSEIASAAGVSRQAIRKWLSAGRLPRTEATGETDYAAAIEAATEGEVTAAEIREWSRHGWNADNAA